MIATTPIRARDTAAENTVEPRQRMFPGRWRRRLQRYPHVQQHDATDCGAACLAMIERSALVSTAFTVRGKQILHARPQYEGIVDTEDGTPPSIGQLVIAAKQPATTETEEYWRSWTTSFDYLYVLFTDEDAPDPDPEHLRLVHDGNRFQLYAILK